MKLKLIYILLLFCIGRLSAQEKFEVFFDFDKYDIIVENWAKFGLLIPSSIRVHKLATLDKKLFYLVVPQL